MLPQGWLSITCRDHLWYWLTKQVSRHCFASAEGKLCSLGLKSLRIPTHVWCFICRLKFENHQVQAL